MPECGTKTCNSQATHEVFWPGQTLSMCNPCKVRSEEVAAAMGFPLTVRALPDERPAPD